MLLAEGRRLVGVFALEDRLKVFLFGIEMLEELALEATPRCLTDAPLPAMDVIEQLREQLVQTLMVGKEEPAGCRHR